MTESRANADFDWSVGTWDGSRRAQLRAWCKLSLRERLEALDSMRDIVNTFEKARAEGRFKSAGDDPTG